MQNKVDQKWGFGMAPPFRATQLKRESSCKIVRQIITTPQIEAAKLAAEDISEIKGLFTRSWKQDQWDWFTVWTRLGRLGMPRAKEISVKLGSLRRAAVDGDNDTFTNSLKDLILLHTNRYLSVFLGEIKIDNPKGQIYILSTRENREILKIGYTERSVEDRVKEINSSTGVVVPFGVRAVWNVANAPELEKKIHDLLQPFRIRSDREFFNLDYREAFRVIRDFIKANRLESEES